MKIKPALFALLIGGLMLLASISFVCAFVQQAEAKRQAVLAREFEKNAEECQRYSHAIKRELEKALEATAQKNRLLEERAATKSKNKK